MTFSPHYVALGLAIVCTSLVAPHTTSVIANVEAQRSELTLIGRVAHRHGKPFDGYVVERSATMLLSRTPMIGGLEHGLAEAWHPNGVKRFERLYRHGHRVGTHRGWWSNGRLQFVYRYEDDLFEGEQRAYFRNGRKSEVRHFHLGHETGRQAFFSANGRLTSNYTFVEGRRYGLVGRMDCVSIRAD